MDNKIKTIIMSIVSLVIVLGLFGNVFARTSPGCCSRGGFTRHYAPPFIIVPPPTWAIEGFTRYWSPNEIVEIFSDKKLEVSNPEVIKDLEQYGFGAVTRELMRFSIPSIGENVQGCVLSFEIRENLEKVRKYYHDLNNSGELYTWSFVKENNLFVTDGVVPEEKAREYESALMGIKQ